MHTRHTKAASPVFGTRICILIAFFSFLCAQLFGQAFYGSIVGTVTDLSGASLRGAQVTLINTATDERRQAQTDPQGDVTKTIEVKATAALLRI